MTSSSIHAHLRRSAAFALVVAAGLALTACSHGDARSARLRGNLTPEKMTLHQRHVDVANVRAITANYNKRQVRDDLEEVFLTNRPSRLSRSPISH